MITRTPGTSARTPAWRRALREAVSSVGELLDLLDLDAEVDAEALAGPLDALDSGDERSAEVLRAFPLRVPRGFVERMRPGDPADPLLRQVLPIGAELESPAGWGVDPLAEADASPVPGLLHKYRGRALLVATGACAVHCRYCFRRHFPYVEHATSGHATSGHSTAEPWSAALDHLAADASIEELILSGGDPLVVSDPRLAALARRVASIGHVRRLRIHTRLPVVLPERVDDSLLAWLAEAPRPVVVLHANHPREIDGSVARAVERLRGVGATVLNQAVLLRGVNDSVEVLVDLSKTLFEAGVMPYYLHELDRVRGAAHFEVSRNEARRLARGILAELPGYLVPKLVREEAGAPSKTPVALFLP